MADSATLTADHDAEAVPGESSAHPHHATSTGISNTKMAMWVFLASDCLLFGALISTFLLYRNNAIEGTVGPIELFDIPFTSVSSFVLLMSSLTMVLAVSAIERGDHRGMRTWLVTTACLGSVFVGGQIYEFTVFYREGLGFTTNVAGSAFYTLTGFHGVHVSAGIVMLLSLVVLSLRGHLGNERAETVEVVGLYWHFVDIVWILIFAVVYLIPVAEGAT